MMLVGSLILVGCDGVASTTGTAAKSPLPGVTPTVITVTAAPAASRTALKNKTPAPSSTPTMSPAETIDVDSSALRGLVVHFWYVMPEQLRVEGKESRIQALLAGFNRTNPWGVLVDAVFYESYADLVKGVLEKPAEERPDLVAVYPYQVARLEASLNALVDLNPYVSDPRWGVTSREVEDFYPLFWWQDVVKGKRLGVPFYRYAQVLFYNLGLAKELGFKAPPTSSQEFLAQACAAAAANRADEDLRNDGTGGWVINTEAATLEGWIYAYQGKIVADSGEGYRLNSTEVRDSFSFLRGMLDSNCAWLAANRYPNSEFATRQAVFITSSTAGILSQEEAFAAEDRQDEWTVVPFPPPYGKPAVVAYGASLAVLKSTDEEQLAAWLFVRWLTETEQQAHWVEYTGAWPVRAEAESLLGSYKKSHPQWAASLKLLPYARLEPGLASWEMGRWALQDAGGQLTAFNFTKKDLPGLLEMLEATLEEIGAGEW